MNWSSVDRELGKINSLLSIRNMDGVDQKVLVRLVVSHSANLQTELVKLLPHIAESDATAIASSLVKND